MGLQRRRVLTRRQVARPQSTTPPASLVQLVPNPRGKLPPTVSARYSVRTRHSCSPNKTCPQGNIVKELNRPVASMPASGFCNVRASLVCSARLGPLLHRQLPAPKDLNALELFKDNYFDHHHLLINTGKALNDL